MSLPLEDYTPDSPSGELVHWMEPGPTRLGPAALSATAVASFALGVVAALGVLAAARWLATRDEDAGWEPDWLH